MSMTQTTPLLEQQRQEEQAALAARHNGTASRRRRSLWVIATLRNYLPPEHIEIAERLAYLQSVIEGCRVMDSKVDCVGNAVELSLAKRIDAGRELYGYERAALTRVGADAEAAVQAIARSDTMTELLHRCGYPRGSNGTARRLIQKTLLALEAYRDENEKARQVQG